MGSVRATDAEVVEQSRYHVPAGAGNSNRRWAAAQKREDLDLPRACIGSADLDRDEPLAGLVASKPDR